MEYIAQLGTAFSEDRTKVYEKGFSGQKELAIETIFGFINTIINELDNTIQLSEDSNGFYHAYNTINLDIKNKSADVKHLPVMLEGQVAALSSGQLDIDNVIALLESLFDSKLYRADQRSFILYPVKDTTPFLQKNIIQPQSISKSKLLTTMPQKKDFNLIEQDADGQIRFQPHFRNAFDLQTTLDQLKNNEDYRNLVENFLKNLQHQTLLLFNQIPVIFVIFQLIQCSLKVESIPEVRLKTDLSICILFNKIKILFLWHCGQQFAFGNTLGLDDVFLQEWSGVFYGV
jgi:hypothetical protein